MHPPFEIPIAGKNRADREVVFLNRGGNWLRQGPRKSGAAHAAKSGDLETKRVKIVLETSYFQVVRHHSGAR